MYSKKEKETVFDKITTEIEKGKAIRNILKNKDYPDVRTFYRWIDEDDNLSKRYARACQSRADALVEDMLDIADDQQGDIYIDSDGHEQTDHNVIQRSRLRVDTRKWIASKLKPKKYGDSQQIKLTDNDGDPLKINAIFSSDILSADTGSKEDS